MRARRLKKVLWIAAGIVTAAMLTLALGCNGSPTTPTPPPAPPPAPYECSLSSEICKGWNQAQNLVKCIGTHTEAQIEAHHAEEIRWRVRQQQVPCGNFQAVAGCFNAATLTITYNENYQPWPGQPSLKWVIRHESGHALLYLLGDPHYTCFQHPDHAGCPPTYGDPCNTGETAGMTACDVIEQ